MSLVSNGVRFRRFFLHCILGGVVIRWNYIWFLYLIWFNLFGFSFGVDQEGVDFISRISV